MAEVPGPSFIPKPNTVKAARRSVARQLYVFTIVAYALMIAALLATAGVFLYQRYTVSVLKDVVTRYEAATQDFDVEAMQDVTELDTQLVLAQQLFSGTLSIPTIFEIIEDATIDTVQFNNVTLAREAGNTIALEASVTTNSFDSVLFQRRMYEGADRLKTVELNDVAIEFAGEEGEGGSAAGRTTVSFAAVFGVNAAAFAPTTTPAIPATTSSSSSTPPSPPVAATTSASVLPTATSSVVAPNPAMTPPVNPSTP